MIGSTLSGNISSSVYGIPLTTRKKDTAPCEGMLVAIGLINTSVNYFDAKKSVPCNWVFVITEFVISGIQCIFVCPCVLSSLQLAPFVRLTVFSSQYFYLLFSFSPSSFTLSPSISLIIIFYGHLSRYHWRMCSCDGLFWFFVNRI